MNIPAGFTREQAAYTKKGVTDYLDSANKIYIERENRQVKAFKEREQELRQNIAAGNKRALEKDDKVTKERMMAAHTLAGTLAMLTQAEQDKRSQCEHMSTYNASMQREWNERLQKQDATIRAEFNELTQSYITLKQTHADLLWKRETDHALATQTQAKMWNQLDDLAARHKVELADLSKTHDAKMAELTETYVVKLLQKEADAEKTAAAHALAMQKRGEEHEGAMNDLAAHHAVELTDLSKVHDAKMAKLTERYVTGLLQKDAIAEKRAAAHALAMQKRGEEHESAMDTQDEMWNHVVDKLQQQQQTSEPPPKRRKTKHAAVAAAGILEALPERKCKADSLQKILTATSALTNYRDNRSQAARAAPRNKSGQFQRQVAK
jgi:hypothetical protein